MKYAFYPGCTYKSAAGYQESVEAVNQALDIEFVDIPDWNCCGATAVFSINKLHGLELAGRVFALAQSLGLSEIVTVCNACYITLRKASEILTAQEDKLAKVNSALAKEGLELKTCLPVRHYLEVLANDIPEHIWAEKCVPDLDKIHVGAYYGCQFTRPWGDVDDPHTPSILENLLKRLGYTVTEHSASTICCGASHSVAYAKECRPLISRIINEIKFKGAQVITTICPLCQFNLDSGQKNEKQLLPVPYFSQLAGLALGISPGKLGLDKLLVSMNNYK